MAEGAAGLGVGVIALAGLFNNAVECFEFIQLGHSFGKNFQTSQLKLDNARLRLSRWGDSLGLNGDISDTKALQERFGSTQNVSQAEALLGQILELFAEAEGVSTKYKDRTATDDSGLAVYNPQTDFVPAMAALHHKMRQLSVERQNRTGLRQKARWALYEEKHFRRLIEDVTDLISGLVELFPASKALQQKLCETEACTLGANESLSVLREIAAEQDKFLEAALAKVAGNGRGSHSIVFSGDGNAGFQLGHNSGSISGFTFGKGS
jgi:Prion-inhibition and propagation/SesB domain on fungal death-pathway protein